MASTPNTRMVEILKLMQNGDLAKLHGKLQGSNLLDDALEQIVIVRDSELRLKVAELLVGLGADPLPGLSTAMEMKDTRLVWYLLQKVDSLPHRNETQLTKSARLLLLSLAAIQK